MNAYRSGSLLLAVLRKRLTVPRPAALEMLRLPTYRYLLLSNTLGTMGNEARLMAQAWLILSLTNSDGWVGTVTGLPALAAGATALLGGVLVDRLNRRTMLINIGFVSAAMMLLIALLVTTGIIQVWHLLVLAILIALLGVSGSTANLTMIADVVPREQLFHANALYSAAANLAIMVGPALAGILIAWAGVEAAFYLGVLLSISATLAVTCIPNTAQRRNKSGTSIWQELKGGLRYVAQTPALLWLTLLGITVIAVGVWFSLVPRYARDVLNAGATGYGTILAARGAGGLVGVITLLAAGRVQRVALVLVGCSLAFATLVLAFAFSTSLVFAATIAFGLGIVFIWWPSTLRTAFQYTASEEMRGRVMSIFSLIGQVLTLGWFAGGVLSEAVGPQSAMIIAALLCAGLNVFAYLRSAELRATGRDDA
jgi:MFS family permease